MPDDGRPASVAPIAAPRRWSEPSVFRPEALLREARRQKGLVDDPVPRMCVLDPDGDIVRRLRADGRARRSASWACYHTELWEVELGRQVLGIVAHAVGAPFAVLVAEQLLASGCGFLVSITSAGQIVPLAAPPYSVVVERALRDEGTSYHYLPPSDFAHADPALVARAVDALRGAGLRCHRGASWTTDAPFRETEAAIDAARRAGSVAVEMEAAGLYAFATARRMPVLCIAHVTNTMGQIDGDFEKGEADGTVDALRLITALAGIAPR